VERFELGGHEWCEVLFGEIRRRLWSLDLAGVKWSQCEEFTSPPPELDARTALGLFVRQAIATLIDSGAIRILGSLMVEEEREPGLLGAFRERILGPRRGMFEAVLRRGIERGEIRPDIDPLVVTEMIAGAVFGHHAILGLPTSDAWIESLVDHVWVTVRA
jgi:hypothetical protein